MRPRFRCRTVQEAVLDARSTPSHTAFQNDTSKGVSREVIVHLPANDPQLECYFDRQMDVISLVCKAVCRKNCDAQRT